MFSNCTYQWSNNVSTNKIGTNLWAGWQYVTITHTDGCVVVDSSLIPDAAPIISASNIQHIKCQDYTKGRKIDLLLNDPANTSFFGPLDKRRVDNSLAGWNLYSICQHNSRMCFK